MTDLVEDLQKKRDAFSRMANNHKRKRDNLNVETRHWSHVRDDLNKKVKYLLKAAREHRKERDSHNMNVRELKELRRTSNKKISEISDHLKELRANQAPVRGIPLPKLKSQLKQLEYKQQTSVLTASKEKSLIEQMNKLQDKIKEREEVEQTDEIKAEIIKLKAAKEEAEGIHLRVQEAARAAQTEHEAMIEKYEEADRFMKEADAAQENFVAAKTAADEEHKQSVELIKQVHDFDKILAGLRQKQRLASQSQEELDTKMQAKDLYKRFMRGEKLSTTEIMTIQKAGLL